MNKMGSMPKGVVIFKYLCIVTGEGRRISTNSVIMWQFQGN